MEEKYTVDEPKKKKKKKLGDPKKGVSDMFRTSYRTHLDLSSIADNKSNMMISINGIIISIIIASLSPKIDSNPWLSLPTALFLISCVSSLIYAVKAARPRVSKEPVSLEDVRMNKANILFFGNYHNMKRDDYVLGMEELMVDSVRLYDTMARDLYGLGQVLAKKYRLLQISYDLFMYGLIASVISFLIVFANVNLNLF